MSCAVGVLLSFLFFGFGRFEGVRLGTILCAFGAGPVMQLVFQCVHFDATQIRHQSLRKSLRVILAHAH